MGELIAPLATMKRSVKFHKPVVVQPGRLDRDRVVVTIAEAAQLLLRDWPIADCEKRMAAMQACLQVIRGEKPPHVAREAFIAAAKDARIYLGEQA
jgi:ribosomal 50S subunit-associated protein YjgA (DUF615 family)